VVKVWRALSGTVEDVVGMLSQGQGLYQCCHHQYRETVEGSQWFARPETGLYRRCHHPYREVGNDHASDAEDRKGGIIIADMSDRR
jgi:hypothetical protein